MIKAKAVPDSVAKPPTTRELTTLLGESHAAFLALTRRRPSVSREWRRYSKKSPWVLKVSQGDRTLFYASPMADAFDVTVVLGERAIAAALGGRVSKNLHPAIRAAKAYVEGRPVRVIIKGLADVAGVEQLVAVKLNPAHDAPAPTISASKRRRPVRVRLTGDSALPEHRSAQRR